MRSRKWVFPEANGVLSMKMSQLTRESHVYLTPEHGTPPGASHGHGVLSRHRQ